MNGGGGGGHAVIMTNVVNKGTNSLLNMHANYHRSDPDVSLTSYIHRHAVNLYDLLYYNCTCRPQYSPIRIRVPTLYIIGLY